MTFKVGDKVRCINGANLISEGETYTITKVESHEPAEFVWLKEACPNEYFNAKRFVMHYGEDTSTNSYNTSLGIAYGILYNSIKDTKEDLWMIAENIAEALEEVEDKL